LNRSKDPHLNIAPHGVVGRILKENEGLGVEGYSASTIPLGGFGNPVYLEYVIKVLGIDDKQKESLTGVYVWDVSKGVVDRVHWGSDVVYLDFYSMLIHPPEGFVEMMRDLGFVDVDCECDGLKSVKCGGGRSVYVPNVVSEKVGRFSPFRKWRNTAPSLSRFVNKLFKLESLGIDYLINIDLTVPKEVSLMWSVDVDKGVEVLKKAFRLFVKRLEKVYGGMLGYFYNVHVWGTKSLEPHFHVHSGFCNAVKVGDRLIRFRPYLDVDFVRGVWVECLRKVGLVIPEVVDVKVRYVALRKHACVVHRVKYMCRHSLVDMASYYADKEYEGLSEEKRAWFLELIYYKNRRISGGFLSRLSKLVGEVKVQKVCPICGRECRDEAVLTLEDAEELKKKFWEEGSLAVVWWDFAERRYKMLFSEAWLGVLKWATYDGLDPPS
jgi:hypothetical protein